MAYFRVFLVVSALLVTTFASNTEDNATTCGIASQCPDVGAGLLQNVASSRQRAVDLLSEESKAQKDEDEKGSEEVASAQERAGKGNVCLAMCYWHQSGKCLYSVNCPERYVPKYGKFAPCVINKKGNCHASGFNKGFCATDTDWKSVCMNKKGPNRKGIYCGHLCGGDEYKELCRWCGRDMEGRWMGCQDADNEVETEFPWEPKPQSKKRCVPLGSPVSDYVGNPDPTPPPTPQPADTSAFVAKDYPCTDSGQTDNDCCAWPQKAGCAPGYTFAWMRKWCYMSHMAKWVCLAPGQTFEEATLVKCLENGKTDADCCAKPAEAGCIDGYVYTKGADCWGGQFFKTVCKKAGPPTSPATTPTATGTTAEPEPEPEPATTTAPMAPTLPATATALAAVYANQRCGSGKWKINPVFKKLGPASTCKAKCAENSGCKFYTSFKNGNCVLWKACDTKKKSGGTTYEMS